MGGGAIVGFVQAFSAFASYRLGTVTGDPAGTATGRDCGSTFTGVT